MKTMKWNKVLATYAQNKADECAMGHTWNRHGLGGFDNCGENLAHGQLMYGYKTGMEKDVAALKKTAKDGVDGWLWEKQWFNRGIKGCIDPSTGKENIMKCGHYIQLIWGPSTDLGCGIAYCPNGVKGFTSKASYSMSCVMGPGGVTIGTDGKVPKPW
jgi:hypothetical protein